jgi:hypothetical protein
MERATYWRIPNLVQGSERGRNRGSRAYEDFSFEQVGLGIDMIQTSAEFYRVEA